MKTVENNHRRAFAVEVVSQLRQAGHQALWAGGCVRDLLLNQSPTDYDVATSARPEAVMALFRRTVPVGVSFGVVRVLGPKEAGEIEVATFRSDGLYTDGRRPESVTFGSAELDASRRDFTINGMFFDPIDENVIDYVGGRADLSARILRAIGDPLARFSEDKLRLLRAVRFASRFGFEIEPSTRNAIVQMAPQVNQVSVERIAKELRVMFTSPQCSLALHELKSTNLIDVLFPDVRNISDMTWQYVWQVFEHLPDSPTFSLAMAALLHPLGGKITEKIARELKLANAERDRMGWLVANQQSLVEPEALRLASLKRILSRPGVDELLALHRAIAMATTGNITPIEYCETYRRDLPDGPLQPEPLLTGIDVRQSGWTPGPQFKEILASAYEAQLENKISNKQEALDWLNRKISTT